MQNINISDIIINREYQTRAYSNGKEECELHIADIAKAVASGEGIPPIVVQRLPNGSMHLTDGFHRTEGHIKAGVATIAATIIDVETEEQVWAAAFGANYLAAKEQKWGRKPSATERRASLALYLERPNTLVTIGHAERYEVAGHTWYALNKKAIIEKLGLTAKDFSMEGAHKTTLECWESELTAAVIKLHKEDKALQAISKAVGVSRDKIRKLIETTSDDKYLAQLTNNTTVFEQDEDGFGGVGSFWHTLRGLKEGGVNLGTELIGTLDKQGEKALLVDWLLDNLKSMEKLAEKVPEDRLGILMERWDC
jgi:hypothetical protein